MSGPITRQYGVPNWDDIFGKKEQQPENSTMPGEPANQDKPHDAQTPPTSVVSRSPDLDRAPPEGLKE